MLSKECIGRVVGRIALMRFFPSSDKGARAIVASELVSICDADNKADWFAKHFTICFKEWPGISEFRAFYCAVYRPADGVSINSGCFPDGIPRQFLGAPPALQKPLGSGDWTPPAKPKQIEGGSKLEQISNDPELGALVAGLADQKAAPPLIRRRSIEEIEQALYKGQSNIIKAAKVVPIQPDDGDGAA